MVDKGFTQQHGVDFFETFAPVAKVQSIRTIFFIASQLDCSMAQFDIPNTYVKAPVDEDIYIQQPQGFVDSDFPEHVLKLKKALYGLKQAHKRLRPLLARCPRPQRYVRPLQSFRLLLNRR